MQRHAILFLLLLTVCAHAAPPVPASAQRYLDILQKRPQPGTIFERFYAAWMEEGTAAGLLEYLAAQAGREGGTAADHLLLAIHHTHRGDDPAALSAYHAALQRDAKNAGAWVERSRIEARMLDFAAALGSLEKADAVKPGDALALDIAKLKGRVLLRLGRNDEALALWKKLAVDHAGDEDLIEELIDLLVDEAQLETAIETARALVERSRDPVARTLRQLRLADILLQAERRDESLAMLDTAFAATGGDTWIEGDVLGRIERLFRMTDDIAGLEKHLSGLVTAHPQRVTLAWQHALLLSATGQQQEALKRARSLLQTNPGRRDLRDEFLDLLDSLNQTQEAIAQAQMIVSMNPDDKELLIRLATLQQRAKDPSSAQATLERYLSAAGTGEGDQLRVARLLEGWEESPAPADSAAAKAYQRLVTTFPDSIGAHEAQAQYLHRSGHRDEALAIWNRLGKTAQLEDLLRIAQALQVRLETRPALDLLLSREAELPASPRLLALIVQCAIANEEFALALPRALSRLRMTRDDTELEDAMRDMRLIMRLDDQKLTTPLLEELQKNNAPSIQDRCLLAVLLEARGDFDAAVQTLKAAPQEEAVTALSQLVRLHQSRQDWAKAADVLQQLMTLPKARTSVRVQLLVDLLRRALRTEEALQQVAAWKTLSPSAVLPWLVEAQVLGELYRPEDALKVLRQAVRRFPDAGEAASACATACLNAGLGEEAERIYLALYEKTTDTTSRLRLLPPLALAALSHDALPQLIENFQRRQKQNRGSAYPWFALAEIHRATRNDEERWRCLYEASRLRPQDLGLLLEIARGEEDAGLYPEAIRTLNAAAKLDKTTKTRERIAKIQIEHGDEDVGYRILFELSGGDQMEPSAIESVAEALAARGDWDHLITFLQPLLGRHPDHYRLHYLHGIALEEAGREPEALAVFLRVLQMHAELPGVTNVPPPVDPQLPPGVADWQILAEVSRDAYVHREWQAPRGNFLLPAVSPSSGLVPRVVLPENVTRSPAYAMVHVLKMSSVWPEEERQRLARQLQRAGVVRPELLLEAAQISPSLEITTELLAAHPQDAMLHAAWLIAEGGGDPDAKLAACERSFALLRQSHPRLALRAAMQALETDDASTSKDAWAVRLIELGATMPRAEYNEWALLAKLLSVQGERSFQESEPSITLSEAQIKALSGILRSWMMADTGMHNCERMMYAFFAVRDWDAAIDCFQHLIDLAAVPGAPQAPQGRHSASPQRWSPFPLRLASLETGLPPYVAVMLETMLEAADDTSPEEDAGKLLAEFRAAMRQRIPQITDARLRLMLRLMCDDASLLEEWQQRAGRPDAGVGDFPALGWWYQQKSDHKQALTQFQKARQLSNNPALIELIDCAVLFSAEKLSEEGETDLARAAAAPLIEQALQQSLLVPEKERIIELMIKHDMNAEADQLQASLQTASTSATAPPQTSAAIVNPYSQALLQRGIHDGRGALERHLAQNNSSSALHEARRRVRESVALWLIPGLDSDAADDLTKLLLLLDTHQLRQPFLQSLKKAAASGWKSRLEYAAVLDMQRAHGRVFQNNDGDLSLSSEQLFTRAAAEYEAVLAARPLTHEARQRLVLLLAPQDAGNALKHWLALPESLQPRLIDPLRHLAKGSPEETRKTTIAITRFITRWLKSRNAARPLPSWAVGSLKEVLDGIQEGGSECPDLWENFFGSA